MSVGMHTSTGQRLSDLDHIRQSIGKILSTPIGTRVMRRSFGSMLPELLDHPLTEQTAVQLYAATATALWLHEPRFRLTRARLDIDASHKGRATLEVSGVAILRNRQQTANFSVPITGTGSAL